MRIEICVGSACHLKGSPDVIRNFQKEIQDNQLENEIVLAASFCLGNCADGVSVIIDGELIGGVFPDTVHEIFERKVLSKVRG